MEDPASPSDHPPVREDPSSPLAHTPAAAAWRADFRFFAFFHMHFREYCTLRITFYLSVSQIEYDTYLVVYLNELCVEIFALIQEIIKATPKKS